jgi:hypothetical protein
MNTDTIETREIETRESTEPVATADLAGRFGDAANRAQTPAGEEHRIALFPETDLGEMRRRWQNVQGSFVDDPKTAVKEADELVASAIKKLTELFADERGKLEREWDKGEQVSTEDLRQALRRYRSFFDRLLSV